MRNCPHCGEEIKPKPRKKALIKTWNVLDAEYYLALEITYLIITNHQSLKRKLSTWHYRQKAAQSISDCKIKHGYEVAELLKICEWVCSNPFWKKQFQAVPKLTRKDNGSTGIILVWIDRFKMEMENSGNRKSVQSINEAFIFEEKK